MEDDPDKSAFVILYGLFAVSGAVVGLCLGWLIWGEKDFSLQLFHVDPACLAGPAGMSAPGFKPSPNCPPSYDGIGPATGR